MNTFVVRPSRVRLLAQALAAAVEKIVADLERDLPPMWEELKHDAEPYKWELLHGFLNVASGVAFALILGALVWAFIGPEIPKIGVAMLLGLWVGARWDDEANWRAVRRIRKVRERR